MPKIGVISIPHQFDTRNHPDFDHFYAAIGMNTGNLLFTTAVWRQIGGKKTRLSFEFDPDEANETFDAIVIPAANWINRELDFSEFADRIEKLRIPVTVIGLGAQQSGSDVEIPLKTGTVRFLRAIADKSVSISVRGEFTAKVLANIGIENVRVTGCPSVYSHYRNFKQINVADFDLERCLIHSTRYSARYRPFCDAKSANLDLFRFAYQNKLDLMFQSEPEEMSHLLGFRKLRELDHKIKVNLSDIYAADHIDDLAAFLDQHGRVYFNTFDWATAVRDYTLVYGSRLHQSILALNSGVPAILVWHDSRTHEIAEFAAIPSIDSNYADISKAGLQQAYENADFAQYYKRREINRAIYHAFLEENNIPLKDQDIKA